MPKRPRTGDTPNNRPTKRPKRRKIIPVKKAKAYFIDRKYVKASTTSAGGKCSTAVLGPNYSSGTIANPELPSGIQKAKETYPKCTFISGHLLNQEFGGSGEDSKNLTILTSSGNGTHKKFDNRVKEALSKLIKIYEALSKGYVDVAEVEYGISIKVQTSAKTWGKETPDAWICNELICSAKVWGNLAFDKLVDSNKAVMNDYDTGAEKNAFEKLRKEVQSHITEMKQFLSKAQSKIPNKKPA